MKTKQVRDFVDQKRLTWPGITAAFISSIPSTTGKGKPTSAISGKKFNYVGEATPR